MLPSGLLPGVFYSAERLEGPSLQGEWYRLQLQCDPIQSAALRPTDARPRKRRRLSARSSASAAAVAAGSSPARPTVPECEAFEREQEELGFVRDCRPEQSQGRPFTRMQNEKSAIHERQRAAAARQRALEKWMQAGIAGARHCSPARGPFDRREDGRIDGQQGSAVVAEEEEEADASSPALLSLLYRQVVSEAAAESSASFVCSCAFLLPSSSLDSALRAGWKVGDYFQRTVREAMDGPVRSRVGRILAIQPPPSSNPRVAHAAERCVRVLWYRVEEVETQEGVGRAVLGYREAPSEQRRLYRCHAIDLVSASPPSRSRSSTPGLPPTQSLSVSPPSAA